MLVRLGKRRKMYAITLKQPWAEAVMVYGKRVENRRWSIPAAIIGAEVALHAGFGVDREGLIWLAEHLGWRNGVPAYSILVELEKARVGAIVGVVRFGAPVSVAARSSDPWAFGPVCWPILEVSTVCPSIPCRGRQRFWILHPDMEAQVRANLSALVHIL